CIADSYLLRGVCRIFSLDRKLDRFYLRLHGAVSANRREFNTEEPAILIGRDHATFVVESHGDPRSLFIVRRGIDVLYCESFWNGDLLRFRIGIHRLLFACIVAGAESEQGYAELYDG